VALGFVQWISHDDPQPTFYFLHTLLPHSPYEYLPTGQRNATRAPVPGDANWTWTNDEWGVVTHYQRHLLQMGMVDRLVGRLVSRLRAEGLYERSMVIVLADHGVAFHPGQPRRSFTEQTAAAVMRVPLVIKLPASRGWPAGLSIMPLGGEHVSDVNVETVDVAPTVADVLGLDLPWKADGVSLMQPESRPRRLKRIWYDSGRRTRTYGPEGPDVSEELARKLALFGARTNHDRVPRPPRFAALLGRRLATLTVASSDRSASIEQIEAFDRVDPRAPAVPFDVAGTLSPRESDAPVYLAVAVNGTIRAVTRTFDSEPRRFVATPPLGAWREGDNDLDLLLVEGDERAPVLRRVDVDND
jgi:hypothetical protein